MRSTKEVKDCYFNILHPIFHLFIRQFSIFTQLKRVAISSYSYKFYSFYTLALTYNLTQLTHYQNRSLHIISSDSKYQTNFLSLLQSLSSKLFQKQILQYHNIPCFSLSQVLASHCYFYILPAQSEKS